jgi:asparagine synthase (glutamine-hydrolysing)
VRGFWGRVQSEALIAQGVEPVHVTSASCTVVFDGMVANRRELCRESGLEAYARDAELVAWAYRRHGVRLAAYVLGEYAAAVFDEKNRLLLLTQDALGIIALFHAQSEGATFFGSTLDGLVALTGTGELDEDYIAGFLAGRQDHGERTPYRHIRRVRQGYSVLVRDGAVQQLRTWGPENAVAARCRNTGEYEEQFRELATEAVATALPATGKVWCELSGGLDSSSLVSLAVARLGARIETFSLIFSQSRDADETEWIDAVLEQYPVPSHRLDADLVRPYGSWPDGFQAEPTGTVIVRALDRARRALFEHNGVEVVLTGMCGDAVFEGDSPQPYYLADIVNPLRLARELRHWECESGLARSTGYWLKRYVLGPRFRGLRRRPMTAAPPLWIHEEYRERWESALQTSQTMKNLPHGTAYAWQRILGGALLVRDGQQHFGAVCAFRNPWLYRPLVEFMATAPATEKFAPNLERKLQRNALRGILPERTRHRRGKRVPTEALSESFQNAKEWHRILTERPLLVERGYVNEERWSHALELARHGFDAASASFMQACVLEVWLRGLRMAPELDDRGKY